MQILSIEQTNLILNAGHDASTLLAKNGEMSVNSLLTRRLVEIVKNLDPTVLSRRDTTNRL